MRAVRVVPPHGRPDSVARSSPKSDAKGQEQCMRVSVQGGSSKKVSSADYHLHSEAPPSPRRSSDAALVLGTTGPLLLAIAGSAIVPLPCAFGQMGIPAGAAFMVLIALANDHTTILLVRAATKLRVGSYEEVVLCTMGERGLFWARVSLVILLFGTGCGSLAAIQETAVRAAQLGHFSWLAGTAAGLAGVRVRVGVMVRVSA